MLGVSGVIATVSCGMTLGWYQHEIFSAAVRTRGTAFWQNTVDFVSGALLHQVTFNGNGAAFPAPLEEQLLAAAQARH